MSDNEGTVRLPGNAISPTADDIADPARSLLTSLRLLGEDKDIEKAGQFGALFSGPPQSVAVIEAGATALAKWWAVGLGTAAATTWGSIAAFWGGQPPDTQRAILWVGAIVSAVALLAIGLIVASDVRGQAAASVAAIEARTSIGRTTLGLAKDVYGTRAAGDPTRIVALASGTQVRYLAKTSDQEDGWTALAIQTKPDSTGIKYLVVKGSEQAWATVAELDFGPTEN